MKDALAAIVKGKRDVVGPTIFAPWVIPENPGGKKWGQGCLLDAPRQGVVHTFVYDIAGVEDVTLVLRAGGKETRHKMTDHGPYPTQTGAEIIANYYTCELPEGAGDVRYYIEATDKAGNKARGALERVYLA
jgi:hypothetical protein